MTMFRVLVGEVHISHVLIEAESAKAALKFVEDGEGMEVRVEYSRTLDSDTWEIKEDDVY